MLKPTNKNKLFNLYQNLEEDFYVSEDGTKYQYKNAYSL